jgi:hypothetical protein
MRSDNLNFPKYKELKRAHLTDDHQMNLNLPINSFSGAWQAFLLFLIPIGGGIPGGVIVAKNHGLPWWMMIILYALSDIVLAFVFEPVMLFIISRGKKSPRVMQFHQLFLEAMRKSTPQIRGSLGPFSLIMFSFGADPMTGRSATKAAGHGFLSGWTIAILGDLLYFSVIMASTLWLNSIFGDGTLVTFAILAFMILVPLLVERIRLRIRLKVR